MRSCNCAGLGALSPSIVGFGWIGFKVELKPLGEVIVDIGAIELFGGLDISFGGGAIASGRFIEDELDELEFSSLDGLTTCGVIVATGTTEVGGVFATDIIVLVVGVMTEVVLVLIASGTAAATVTAGATAGAGVDGGESNGFSGMTMSFPSSTGSGLGVTTFASLFSAAFSALDLRFDLRGGSCGS